jgi:hypothetical protein
MVNEESFSFVYYFKKVFIKTLNICILLILLKYENSSVSRDMEMKHFGSTDTLTSDDNILKLQTHTEHKHQLV